MINTSASLFTEISLLRTELASHKTLLEKEIERNRFFEEENTRLLEMLRQLKIQAFGPRSERWESEEQIKLFNEAEELARKPEQEEKIIKVGAHTKKRGKRRPLPSHLPREVVRVELPLEKRVNEEGEPLREIGKEVSEKFVYEPGQMKVIEYHRIRYGVDSGDTGIIAQPLPSIIPKSMVTPSLLSKIVTDKFADGLPFYRQEEIFGRLEIDLPRTTMARWVITASEKCRAIWNILEDRLMASPYVSCDETHIQVLKEKNRSPENKSWMWVRCTPCDLKKIILFDYDPHRSGAVAKKLFTDYKGALQCDGYDAYNILEKQEGVERLGCNMHGRRKFREALSAGAKQGHTLAEVGLKFYHDLYEFEEPLKSVSFDERYKIRNLQAVPLWEKFKAWAVENQSKVPPKSKIGGAFHYFLNEYEYLIGYLKNGMFEMDNGFAERAIKYFAIGRKNWLFSDTESGAEASSLFYSFVVTAKLNGVNPYQALKQIFELVPLAETIDDFERLADLLVTPKIIS